MRGLESLASLFAATGPAVLVLAASLGAIGARGLEGELAFALAGEALATEFAGVGAEVAGATALVATLDVLGLLGILGAIPVGGVIGERLCLGRATEQIGEVVVEVHGGAFLGHGLLCTMHNLLSSMHLALFGKKDY